MSLVEAVWQSEEIIVRKARENILAFTIATKDDYKINWHHKSLANKLTDFANGKIRFLMVFMPPRHGKSELVSRRLPAFLHGRYPDAEIMCCSYLDSLAGEMTTAVQEIIDMPIYQRIFPRTKIPRPSLNYTKGIRNSSEHHILGHRGKYRGQGVGGSFTGKGANFIIIDDPIKGREVADSVTFRERLFNFYNNDLFSRLENDLSSRRLGQVLITQCMTGDTLVLMANGSEVPLREVKAGDPIATYDDGKISISIIKNWKNSGPDLVYAIKTSSGIIVKANKRHPFLVCRNGDLEWVRLKDLKVNDELMVVKENGADLNAQQTDAKGQRPAKGTAPPTITKPDGRQELDHHQTIQYHTGPGTYAIDMELSQRTTTGNLPSNTGSAPFARHSEILHPTGDSDYVLTTAMEQTKYEDYFVTGAILLSNTEPLNRHCSQRLITYDHIVEISEAGYEDVFDIQVDRTENFIANGLVSHNTRWHEDDLSGRLIELMNKDTNAVQWEIINYPAIRVDMDTESDPREIGEALWPEKYGIDQLSQIKSSAGPRAWSSLYQQSPVPDGGGLFNENMFEFIDLPDRFDWSFITADTSYKEKHENDFTVFTALGVVKDQLFVRDVWRKQIKSADVELPVEAFIRRFMQYGYRGTYIEPKGHGIYLNQIFSRKGLMIPGENRLKEFYSDRRHDKVERANNVIPHLSSRKLYINKLLSNKEELVAECLSFPKAKHDDFVDTIVDALKLVYAREIGSLDVV